MRVLLFSSLLLAANAGQWKVASKGSSIIFSFGISDSHGTAYASSIQNGVGSQALKTNNLGVSWNVTHKGDIALMLGCGTLNPKHAVVTGAIGEVIYTKDGGKSWEKSLAFSPGSQSIEVTNNRLMYGIAGGRGVHTSSTLGASFKKHNIKGENSTRYGSFLDEKTWYVSAGSFPQPTPAPTQDPNFIGHWVEDEQGHEQWVPAPQQESEPETIKQISSLYSIKRDVNGTVIHDIDFEYNGVRRRMQGTHGRYSARIWKTSDGGASWKNQFTSVDQFYFNGINCCNPTTCYAVGEGYSKDGGVQGAVIYKTEDGSSWKQVWKSDGSGQRSLMAARCLGDGSEAWAAGGNIVRPGFEGEFYHTMDGGQTWKLQYTNKAASVLAMEYAPDFKSAMATGLSISSGGVVYQYS